MAQRGTLQKAWVCSVAVATCNTCIALHAGYRHIDDTWRSQHMHEHVRRFGPKLSTSAFTRQHCAPMHQVEALLKALLSPDASVQNPNATALWPAVPHWQAAYVGICARSLRLPLCKSLCFLAMHQALSACTSLPPASQSGCNLQQLESSARWQRRAQSASSNNRHFWAQLNAC